MGFPSSVFGTSEGNSFINFYFEKFSDRIEKRIKEDKLREYSHGEPFHIAFPFGKNRKYAPAVATNQS